MEIMVVEDDARLCGTLVRLLARAGYTVASCRDGAAAVGLCLEQPLDLVVLDRMLPGLDGLDVLRELRRRGFDTPVLMLTALGEPEHRVEGLDAGADDYLAKPFDTEELLARVRALLRRVAKRAARYTCGNTVFDAAAMQLSGPKAALPVTGKLCRLVELFYENQGDVVPRTEIFARVWGVGAAVENAVIDNYVCFFRRYLTRIGADARLITVPRTGYRLTAAQGEDHA